MLQSQVTGGKAKVPPPLFETYAEALKFGEPAPAYTLARIVLVGHVEV